MKKKILKSPVFAIALGFLVIPSGLIVIPLSYLSKFSFDMSIGDLLVGLPFGLGTLGLLGSLILVGLIFLVKLSVPVFLSRILTESWKLAFVTLASAIFIQTAGVVFLNPMKHVEKAAKDLVKSEFEAENIFKNSAEIGDIKHNLESPTAKPVYPQYGIGYTKLLILIPLTLKEAGQYQIKLHYSNQGRSIRKTIEKKYRPGKHKLEVDLLPGDFRSNYLWLKGGTSKLTITLLKLTSEKDIYGGLYREKEKRYWEITRKKLTLKDVATIKSPF